MRKFQRHGNKKFPIWGNFYLVLNALDSNILNFDRTICLCRTAISTFESPVFILIGIWLTIVCKLYVRRKLSKIVSCAAGLQLRLILLFAPAYFNGPLFYSPHMRAIKKTAVPSA